MNREGLVSVVIPFFNRGQFLDQAIESVFGQTHTNWEILLVDDGSTDHTTATALKFAEKYPERIRYFEHENHQNLGVGCSRNLGISQARGEYIALLDSDDAWFPMKLVEQVLVLRTHADAGMVYGNRMYWKSWAGNVATGDPISELGFEGDKVIYPPWLMIHTFVHGKTITPVPSDYMFRPELAKRVGGFEESFVGPYGMYEDQAFLAKVFLNEIVYASSACWTKYRSHADSVADRIRTSGGTRKAWEFYLNWLEKYLAGKNMQETEIWRTLQKRLFRYRHPIRYKFGRLLRRLQPS